jgi:hypothetical protein
MGEFLEKPRKILAYQVGLCYLELANISRNICYLLHFVNVFEPAVELLQV